MSASLPSFQALLQGRRRELEPRVPRGTPGLSQAVCEARGGLGTVRARRQAPRQPPAGARGLRKFLRHMEEKDHTSPGLACFKNDSTCL